MCISIIKLLTYIPRIEYVVLTVGRHFIGVPAHPWTFVHRVINAILDDGAMDAAILNYDGEIWGSFWTSSPWGMYTYTYQGIHIKCCLHTRAPFYWCPSPSLVTHTSHDG